MGFLYNKLDKDNDFSASIIYIRYEKHNIMPFPPIIGNNYYKPIWLITTSSLELIIAIKFASLL